MNPLHNLGWFFANEILSRFFEQVPIPFHFFQIGLLVIIIAILFLTNTNKLASLLLVGIFALSFFYEQNSTRPEPPPQASGGRQTAVESNVRTTAPINTITVRPVPPEPPPQASGGRQTAVESNVRTTAPINTITVSVRGGRNVPQYSVISVENAITRAMRERGYRVVDSGGNAQVLAQIEINSTNPDRQGFLASTASISIIATINGERIPIGPGSFHSGRISDVTTRRIYANRRAVDAASQLVINEIYRSMPLAGR